MLFSFIDYSTFPRNNLSKKKKMKKIFILNLKKKQQPQNGTSKTHFLKQILTFKVLSSTQLFTDNF